MPRVPPVMPSHLLPASPGDASRWGHRSAHVRPLTARFPVGCVSCSSERLGGHHQHRDVADKRILLEAQHEAGACSSSSAVWRGGLSAGRCSLSGLTAWGCQEETEGFCRAFQARDLGERWGGGPGRDVTHPHASVTL